MDTINNLYYWSYYLKYMSKIFNKNIYLEYIINNLHKSREYLIPIIVILTLPLWAIPYLIFIAIDKTINIIKYLHTAFAFLINTTHSAPLHYAILKGNGRYLRQNCSEVLINQFYDYTARRFMSVGQLEQETRIAELQCQNQIGLIYLKDSNKLQIVNGLQSSTAVLKQAENDLGFLLPCDYSISGASVHYDCVLLFNFKQKMRHESRNTSQKIDLTTILRYCAYHLDESGYFVYGDYFQQGEIKTFISLFQAYNFYIVQQEDITKNIVYAQKLTKRRNQTDKPLIQSVLQKIRIFFGRKQDISQGRNFIVFILQKAKPKQN